MPNFIYHPPRQPFLSIIYQDDDVVIFDKAAGLLSVPGRLPEHHDSLWLRAKRVWPSLTVVHRLDMATSGLIVMALSKAAQSHLGRQFQQRQTQKTYHAEIWGHLTEEQGSVELALRCDWPNRPRQIVDPIEGKAAQTHYRLLERREHSDLVELRPITGRSHQLRVHMQALGCPIVGDMLYAPVAAQHYSSRLHLHATQLGFFHPRDDRWVTFNSNAAFSTQAPALTGDTITD